MVSRQKIRFEATRPSFPGFVDGIAFDLVADVLRDEGFLVATRACKHRVLVYV